MIANPNAELKNTLERKLKLASSIIVDYIYDEEILDRWVNIFALHDSLSKEVKGPKIQKQLSKVKGVLIWQPDVEDTTYTLYDLFLFFVPSERLEPAQIQFLFAYFYPIKLIRNFLYRKITEDIYGGLALFTKEYQLISDYVERTATVFYDWAQKENEKIIDFFEEKISELKISDFYIVELLRQFKDFENAAKRSSIQQWNYMQSKILAGENVLDAIKDVPNLKEIYDTYNMISEDPTSFPKEYYSMKKLSKSPQMLFDLQEEASISKQYFIDEYNKIQLSNIERLRSYFQGKFKLVQTNEYTTRLAANIQKVIYQLKLLKLPKYYEGVYDDLQIMQADFIETIIEIDKDTKSAYDEMVDSLEFSPKRLKDTAFTLSAGNLFKALNVMTDPILFEENDEILDFFERIKTNANLLYSLRDEIKNLPILPAPQWFDFELKESLLWLAQEHPQAFIETNKPKYINHAFYHAATDYQKGFSELLYAYDALTFLKQTFNIDWFILRLQIIDYLRFFAKLDDYGILPQELKFVDYEALEDLLSQAYTPESIKQLQKYIMTQYAWVTDWVKKLNRDTMESLDALYNLLGTITALPPLGADFKDNLKKVEAWLKTVNFKELTTKIEMYLAKLGELLRQAAAYQEALYDFVFTRNFHMVFDYYIDDFYDIFEQVPDLSWKAVVGQISFENLIAYMKQNEILFVLGLKQLQASLVEVFTKRASTLVDALDTLERGASKEAWPLIVNKIHYDLGIEVKPLYILPFAFEYGVI